MKKTSLLLALFLGLNMGALAFNAVAEDLNKGSALELIPRAEVWLDQFKPDDEIGYILMADNDTDQELEWKEGDGFSVLFDGPLVEPGGDTVVGGEQNFLRRSVRFHYSVDSSLPPGVTHYGSRFQDDPNQLILSYFQAIDVDHPHHNQGFKANKRNQGLTYLVPDTIRDTFPLPDQLVPGFYRIAITGYNQNTQDYFGSGPVLFIEVTDETSEVDLTPILEAIAEVQAGVDANASSIAALDIKVDQGRQYSRLYNAYLRLRQAYYNLRNSQ